MQCRKTHSSLRKCIRSFACWSALWVASILHGCIQIQVVILFFGFLCCIYSALWFRERSLWMEECAWRWHRLETRITQHFNSHLRYVIFVLPANGWCHGLNTFSLPIFIADNHNGSTGRDAQNPSKYTNSARNLRQIMGRWFLITLFPPVCSQFCLYSSSLLLDCLPHGRSDWHYACLPRKSRDGATSGQLPDEVWLSDVWHNCWRYQGPGKDWERSLAAVESFRLPITSLALVRSGH